MIVVAHRLSTIESADLIIFLKDGQVLERGTHTQLKDKKGAYYQLLQSQTVGENKPGGAKVSSASFASQHVSMESLAPLEDESSRNLRV